MCLKCPLELSKQYYAREIAEVEREIAEKDEAAQLNRRESSFGVLLARRRRNHRTERNKSDVEQHEHTSQLSDSRSVKDHIHDLARQHGVVYVSNSLDKFSEAISRVSGDDVEMDETQYILIALVRAGIVPRKNLALIHSGYLKEKYGDNIECHL